MNDKKYLCKRGFRKIFIYSSRRNRYIRFHNIISIYLYAESLFHKNTN